MVIAAGEGAKLRLERKQHGDQNRAGYRGEDVSFSDQDAKKEDERESQRSRCLELTCHQDSVEIGEYNEDEHRDSADEQSCWPKQRPQQAEKRGHGKRARANILVGPFALEADQEAESNGDADFQSDLRGGKWLVRAVNVLSQSCIVNLQKPLARASGGCGEAQPPKRRAFPATDALLRNETFAVERNVNHTSRSRLDGLEPYASARAIDNQPGDGKPKPSAASRCRGR